MTIKIVTDSTCDLPEEVIAEHDITIVPLYINMDGESYLDGVEISRQEFYERLPNCQDVPTTSAPGPGRVTKVYERLAEDGTTEIISIHISATLSNMVNVARIAADAVKGIIPVTVFDSSQITLGTGLLVQAAAEAVRAGSSVAQTVTALEERARRTYTFAALDTLEFLRRSGRVGWLQAGLGALLKIKPLLKMHQGEATTEKVRTTRGAFNRLSDLASELAPLEQLALVHAHAQEKVETLRQHIEHLLPENELMPEQDPLIGEVTPVIGTHVGPNAVGLICVKAPVT